MVRRLGNTSGAGSLSIFVFWIDHADDIRHHFFRLSVSRNGSSLNRTSVQQRAIVGMVIQIPCPFDILQRACTLFYVHVLISLCASSMAGLSLRPDG